jgi:hypothetical protein
MQTSEDNNANKNHEKKNTKTLVKVKSVEATNKDKEMKDKIFKEERLRLQNEHLKKKIVRIEIFICLNFLNLII